MFKLYIPLFGFILISKNWSIAIMDNFALLSMGSSNVPEYSGLRSHIYIVNYTFIRKYRQCPKRCKSYEVTEEKANF